MAISPLFKWIKFGAGGVWGLAGDGKVLLALTVLAGIVFVLAITLKKGWLSPLLLAVQSWGVIATFWMGSLFWKIAAVFDSSEIADNPFASMLATQIGPGAGLYLGLIGSMTVAGSVGFIVFRVLQSQKRLLLFFISQGFACLLGVVAALLLGVSLSSPSQPALPVVAQSNAASNKIFGGATGQVGRAAEMTKWQNKHNLSKDQLWQLVDDFIARKAPELVGSAEWWEEAADKTPADMARLYPPLKPHEFYRAEWAGGYSGSRDLDRNTNFGDTSKSTYRLTMLMRINTEPDLPIKELYGKLVFVKGGEVVYEVVIAEKPDVSFTDSCYLYLKVDPYDDENEVHRTLRYSKDDELKPVFTVSEIVLADGKKKVFQVVSQESK